MHRARKVGIITVAVAATAFSSTSARAQRTVGADCAWPANAAGSFGSDGECALGDATARLFELFRGRSGRDVTPARGRGPGLDELGSFTPSDPFNIVFSGASAADRRRASAGDDGLAALLWGATSPGSGVGATSFWLDVLAAARSFDSGRTIATGLATSPSVFIQSASAGSNGAEESSEHGVQSFADPIGDNPNLDSPYFFQSHDPAGGPDGALAVTTNPEPGSLALIATGLVGLGGLGMRRRKASRR